MTPQLPHSHPQTPERRFIWMGWLVIALGLAGLGAWGGLAPLDRGVTVPGTLVAEGNRQPVQHTSGGRVESVLVRDGEWVKVGQPLMRLDVTAVESAIDAAEAAQAGLREQLLATRQSLESRLRQMQLLQEQLDRLRPLAQDNLVPRNRLTELERQIEQLAGQVAQDRGIMAQTRQQIEEIGQRVRAQRHEVELATLVATSEGTVQSLAVTRPGAVIGAGQTILEIVPADTAMVVEARVPVHLIDRLQPGLPVELMFTALNQNRTPVGSGTVQLVSPDRMVEPRSGLPYYLIRTSIDLQSLGPLDRPLRHGMPVDAFVKTGERTLWSYLLKPLADRLHQGMRED